MSNRVTWILDEVAAWEREGLVDSAVAEKLRQRYGTVQQGGRNWALLAFGLLGALLTGGGVVLLLAHNWADFSRPLRTALAVAPLVVAQGLAALGMVRDWRGAAWRESLGVFWLFAVAAAVALVGQVYHLGGTFDGFLMTCLLLALPVVYLMQSAMAGALYAGAALLWACQSGLPEDALLGFWGWIAALLPFLRSRRREDPWGVATTLLHWVVVAVATAGVGVSLARALPGLWILVHAAWFALLVLADRRWGADAPTAWHRPLRVAGWAGIVALSLMLTYEWPWRSIGWSHYHYDVAPWRQVLDAAIAVGLAASVGLLLVRQRGVAREVTVMAPLMPAAATAGFWLASGGRMEAAALVLDAYVLALGLALLIGGLRRAGRARVNAGMLLLTALILLRFFDSDLNLLYRGIAFVSVGIAFFGINLALARRARSVS